MIQLQVLLSTIYIVISYITIKQSTIRLTITFIILILSAQLIFNLLNLYNIHTINNYTILIFNLNILSFLIGATLYKYKPVKSNKSIFYIKNINLLLKIIIVYTIISFYYYQKFITILSQVDESSREILFQQGTLFTRYYEQFFFMYLVSPSKYLSFGLFTILLFKKVKSTKEYFLLLLCITNALILAQIGYGRFDYFTFAIFPIGFFILNKDLNPKLIKKRFLPLLFTIIIISIILIAITTAKRLNIDNFDANNNITVFNTFTEQCYQYFSFPISAFEYGIENFFNNQFFWGSATLAGLEELITTPIRLLNKDLFSTNNYIGNILSREIPLYGYKWNALYTGVFNYYLDFGICGVIIFPVFIGYILSSLLAKTINERNVFHTISFLFFFSMCILNLFSSRFQWTGFWFFMLELKIFKKYII